MYSLKNCFLPRKLRGVTRDMSQRQNHVMMYTLREIKQGYVPGTCCNDTSTRASL